MTILSSAINPKDPQFLTNDESMRSLVQDLP